MQEHGVWDKILFGTDYPFTTVNATIEGLYKLNRFTEGNGLPRLDDAQIKKFIYRDSLAILGLER